MSGSSNSKRRLDVALVELGLAQSRERAQALILTGDVLVNDEPITKAGASVPEGARIRLRRQDHPYVSRGALKLEKAIQEFKIQVGGKACLDVGASTGGFTEVLLLHGAKEVLALDVGHNQLDWKIRNDPRVRVLEKTNARYLKWEDLRQKFDVIVMDVSFISVTLILPALMAFAHDLTHWVLLIKPQFEAGKDEIGKGGIVMDPEVRARTVEKVTESARSLGLARIALVDSPITGTDGNIEFLAHFTSGTASADSSAGGL